MELVPFNGEHASAMLCIYIITMDIMNICILF